MQHLNEEDIAAFVKNWKTTDELGASDTGNDSEDNGDDSFEVCCLFELLVSEVSLWVCCSSVWRHLCMSAEGIKPLALGLCMFFIIRCQ
jgi:hypothetical protein